jgi:hypothetical protein
MSEMVLSTGAQSAGEGVLITGQSGARHMYDQMMNSPSAMTAMVQLSDYFQKSQIMGVKTPGDAMVLATTCVADGMTPIEFVRTNHIIQGKPCRKAEFMLAEFMRMGGKVKWVQTDNKIAKAVFMFEGNETTDSFTIEDAARMVGSDKLNHKESNWYKDPAAMLRWRLVTRVLRYVCPAATGGFYLTDEVEAIAPDPAVSAAQFAARQAELQRLAQEPPAVVPAATQVQEPETVDVTPEPAEVVATEPVAEPVAEPAPVAKVTNDVLQAIVALAAKLGKSVAECASEICEAAGVKNPADMTAEQGAKLLARYQSHVDALAS